MTNFWSEVESIFTAAAELSPAQRETFLQSRCSNNPDLLREVRSLLAYDTGDAPVWASAVQRLSYNIVDQQTLRGARVGRYELGDKIGEGGMGVVYRAARADDEFRQT